MKFKLRPGACHYPLRADSSLGSNTERMLGELIHNHVQESRGKAAGILYIDGRKTPERSHYVSPFVYQLAYHGELLNVANLNDASISIPSDRVQTEGRRMFAKEQRGELTDEEKNEIEDSAREHAAHLIHADNPQSILLGRNTTEVVGLAYQLADVGDGDILVSDAENASIYIALQHARDNGNPMRADSFAAYPTWYSSRGPRYQPLETHKRTNKLVRFGLETVDSPDDIYRLLRGAISRETKFMAFSHVIRTTGKEVPVKRLCAWARAIKAEKNPEDPGIFILIDGAQAVGNLPVVDFQEIGADAYAFSTYKTLGSPPIGLLAVDTKNPAIRARMAALHALDPRSEQIVLRGMVDRNIGEKRSNVDDSLSYADLHAFNTAMYELPPSARQGDCREIADSRWRLRGYFQKKLEGLNEELAQLQLYQEHSNRSFGYPGDVEVKYSFMERIGKAIRRWALSSDPRAKESDIERELKRDAVVAEVDVDRPTSFILSFFFRGAFTDGREEVIWEQLAQVGSFCSCIAFDRRSDQPSVFRVSFGLHTTTEEIDRFMDNLKRTLLRPICLTTEQREQRERNDRIESLSPSEKEWRMYPGDGEDPRRISDTARRREWHIHEEVAALLDDAYDYRHGILDDRGYHGRAEAQRAAYELIKYFPVLWISAPHIESKVHAAFPGEPTPLLYATAVLDRYLRIDEFPSERRVPKITSVMNPPMYSEQFEQQLIDHLRQCAPRVVGISNIAEGHYFALKIAQLVKEYSPSSIVLFGGSHEDNTHPAGYRQAADRAKTGKKRGASSEVFQMEEEALRKMDTLRTLAEPEERQWIDFVISGDAPFALVEFMKMIADHPGIDAAGMKQLLSESRDAIAAIPGSGYFSYVDENAGGIVDLPLSGKPIDRSTLPFIDRRHLTNDNRFPVFDYKKTAQVMASVGCKYACEFCCESADAVLQNVPNLQPREPEHVWQELQMLAEQGYEAVFFDDSTFTQTPSLTHRLLDLMIAQPLGLEWGCQTTINDVDEALLERMAEAGCTYVYFGFEQASAQEFHVQKSLKTKTISSDASLPILEMQHSMSHLPWITRFQQVASLCKSKGIRVGTSLQFGLGESDQARKDTIDVIAEMVASGIIPEGSVALNINALYPGTVQWVRAMADSKPLPDYRQKLERDVRFETAHQFGSLRPDEVELLYQYANSKLGKALLQ